MFALNALARAHFICSVGLLGGSEELAAEAWTSLSLDQVQIGEKAMQAALELLPELGAGALEQTLEQMRPRHRNARDGLKGMVRRISAEPQDANPAGEW